MFCLKGMGMRRYFMFIMCFICLGFILFRLWHIFFPSQQYPQNTPTFKYMLQNRGMRAWWFNQPYRTEYLQQNGTTNNLESDNDYLVYLARRINSTQRSQLDTLYRNQELSRGDYAALVEPLENQELFCYLKPSQLLAKFKELNITDKTRQDKILNELIPKEP